MQKVAFFLAGQSEMDGQFRGKERSLILRPFQLKKFKKKEPLGNLQGEPGLVTRWQNFIQKVVSNNNN